MPDGYDQGQYGTEQFGEPVLKTEATLQILANVIVEGGGGTIPVSAFIASPIVGNVPLTVSFDARSSTDPDGALLVSYEWDFGDGAIATGKVVEHTYEQIGEYTVTLVVTDVEGLQDTAYETIEVNGGSATLYVSDRFKEAMRYSHQGVFELDLIDHSGRVWPLYPISGEMTINPETSVWRNLDCTVALDQVGTASREALEQLSVIAGDIVVRAGIIYPDGQREVAQIARLRCQTFERVASSPEVKVTATDYASMLEDHPVDPATGSPNWWNGTWAFTGVIAGLIEDSIPQFPAGFPNPRFGVSAKFVEEQGGWEGLLKPKLEGAFVRDRLDLIREWCEAESTSFYNWTTGAFYVGPHKWRLTVGELPAMSLKLGDKDQWVVDYSEEFDRREIFNGVKVTYASTDADVAPVRAFVVNTDFSDATYWGGPFGKRVKEVSNIPVKSVWAAEQYARDQLDDIRGRARSLRITGLRFPTLQPGQLLEIQLPSRIRDTETPIWEIHHVETVRHDLAGATTEITTKWSGQLDETFREAYGWAV